MAVPAMIGPQLDEATLVRAAQNGDRVAFGTLYQQHGRLVHAVLLAHVPYQDAEDLAQDVFVKGLTQLPSLREPAAFTGWLMAIARRLPAAQKTHVTTGPASGWRPRAERRGICNTRPDSAAARELPGDFDSPLSGRYDRA